ncbi:CapA family protein [Nocardioides sp. C4-1]|uniref:CapA family protein n=1 Tax=Nocardioides sp. C4-1 TaxID=3151851 RepID=UPI0032652AF3
MRRRALTLLALAAVTACAAEAPAPDDPSTSTSTPSATPATPAPTTSAPPPSAPRPRPFTLAVAGDVHFEGPLRARLDDPATALAPATRALAAADVAMVNLETSVGTGGAPEPGKRFLFEAPASAFAALGAAGVDVVTMANNHVLDFGRGRLRSTFAAISAGPVDVVGIGRDADEAFAPAVLDVDGTSVAVLGATTAGADPTADPTGQWAATDDRPGTADALDPARLLAAVRDADRGADVVVAYLHWGVQGERCPDDRQRSLARRLVEAGADVVVGSHTHGLQGDGRLGPGYVAYGLGNYAWYTGSDTAVLTLTVRPPATPSGRARVTRAAWEPARTGPDGLPTAVPRAGFDAEIASLRSCAGF